MTDFLGETVPLASLLLLVGAALVAATARGFSGFGGTLIFMPVASAAIGPKAAAPLLLIIDGIAAAGLHLGSRLFGHASETMFRRICYGLIAAAVVLSLPVLDGVLRPG